MTLVSACVPLMTSELTVSFQVNVTEVGEQQDD